MDWKEIYNKNPASLKDSELSELIQQIKEYRIEKTQNNSMSTNECNMLLALIYGEQSSRSSAKLAKTAIYVSVLSLIVSVVLGAIGIMGS